MGLLQNTVTWYKKHPAGWQTASLLDGSERTLVIKLAGVTQAPRAHALRDSGRSRGCEGD